MTSHDKWPLAADILVSELPYVGTISFKLLHLTLSPLRLVFFCPSCPYSDFLSVLSAFCPVSWIHASWGEGFLLFDRSVCWFIWGWQCLAFGFGLIHKRLSCQYSFLIWTVLTAILYQALSSSDCIHASWGNGIFSFDQSVCPWSLVLASLLTAAFGPTQNVRSIICLLSAWLDSFHRPWLTYDDVSKVGLLFWDWCWFSDPWTINMNLCKGLGRMRLSGRFILSQWI